MAQKHTSSLRERDKRQKTNRATANDVQSSQNARAPTRLAAMAAATWLTVCAQHAVVPKLAAEAAATWLTDWLRAARHSHLAPSQEGREAATNKWHARLSRPGRVQPKDLPRQRQRPRGAGRGRRGHAGQQPPDGRSRQPTATTCVASPAAYSKSTTAALAPSPSCSRARALVKPRTNRRRSSRRRMHAFRSTVRRGTTTLPPTTLPTQPFMRPCLLMVTSTTPSLATAHMRPLLRSHLSTLFGTAWPTRAHSRPSTAVGSA